MEPTQPAAPASPEELLVAVDDGPPPAELLPLPELGELTDRILGRLASLGEDPSIEARQEAWRLLDVLRRSSVLTRIRDAGATDDWARRILALVESSHFTFGQLFAQRAASRGDRALFRLPGPPAGRALTWRQVAGRIDLAARGLLAVTAGTSDQPIAILSENRVEMAIIDFACLSSGIVNVMIPATASNSDVAYILKHSRAGAVVVSTREQLAKVLTARAELPELQTIVAIAPDAAAHADALPYDLLFERASAVPADVLADRRDRVRIDDLASVMYTSGTTGTPKGICFSQRNIVYKRFARALALPEIGEDDRFLAYLPLFHTFGRFLELAGCVFWGATYCFADSPAIETLARQMRELRPTVFISIPMKWMQLYELVCQEVDVEAAEEAEIAEATRRVTGGALRWGLSAAGYLDPEIFRFFQRNGVELMSGFGMTEATGGITMTPPGRYQPDSLGGALPGIEIALADDGELKIRGPYVMIGYLDPPDGETGFDEEGWLSTGDIMELDDAGFIRIIDRKKEIYKNVKGQTIAPQKIENLYRDFDSVGRVFLIGDQRQFNTALIYPNFEFEDLDLAALSAEDLKAHFRSLVVSANAFLAPFERIVDFAVIDRDFDGAKGELTPKGTYRRKAIERNFADVIRPLYRRTTVTVGGVDVMIRNWLLQALGITPGDLHCQGSTLGLSSEGTSLTIERLSDREVRVGSVVYRHGTQPVDLGLLLSTPNLWFGNEQLYAFAPLERDKRDRKREVARSVRWLRRTGPYRATDADRTAAEPLVRKTDLELADLHLIALLLGAEDPADPALAVQLLEHILTLDDESTVDAARHLLRRAAGTPSADALRHAFRVLAAAEQPLRYREALGSFLDGPVLLLDDETIEILAEHDSSIDQLQAFINETTDRCQRLTESEDEAATARALLDFLSEYGTIHPTSYSLLRTFFTDTLMLGLAEEIHDHAADARSRLEDGFRRWLGQPSRVAVDPETGLEYRWNDVVDFADDVDEDARKRILKAIKKTPILQEAVFLFSEGMRLRLEHILPNGVWIRLLGTDHGKSVYRVAVKTRQRVQYDLAINLNRSLSTEEVLKEIDCLIACGGTTERGPLVETFGGYWPDYGLWTEEFIAGQTLDKMLRRLARNPREHDRLAGFWPYAAWSAMAAYVDLWDRTGETDAAPNNVIVPMHDYLIEARLVSISGRRPFPTIMQLLNALRDDLVGELERAHEPIRGLAGWDVAFSAVLETVGEQAGLALLRDAELVAGAQEMSDECRRSLSAFIAAVERRGFLPKRLFFGAKRYRRWLALNPEATMYARAATMQEVYDTYVISALQSDYPEVRAQFFRRTVFRDARPPLSDGLDELVDRLRKRTLPPEDLSAAIADLRAQLTLSDAEDYFLTRLSYPYLRPEDQAEFVPAEAGGERQSEMVVTLEDLEGNLYRIRHALSPKEVGRLHRLFLAAKMPVQFRPEHRFLVAISDRGHIIGGLSYEVHPEEHTAHMDKVAVSDAFQRKGIATALLNELFNRLRTDGYHSLTTGFFRPQFFYGHGFTVERRYAGLVRSLDEVPDQD